MNQASRNSWDSYFMKIAKDVSTRGTCLRKKVGCVITKENRILTTGYNGSMSGDVHCEVVGCLMENDHCVRTIHAEINAIVQAAKFGINIGGGTMYVTFGPPCWQCFKPIANAGIKKIVFIKEDSTTE